MAHSGLPDLCTSSSWQDAIRWSDILDAKPSSMQCSMSTINKVLKDINLTDLVEENNVEIFEKRYLSAEIKRKDKGEIKAMSICTYLMRIVPSKEKEEKEDW